MGVPSCGLCWLHNSGVSTPSLFSQSKNTLGLTLNQLEISFPRPNLNAIFFPLPLPPPNLHTDSYITARRIPLTESSCIGYLGRAIFAVANCLGRLALMFCTQCGTQLDQGTNFCKNCGTRVNKTTDPVVAGEDSQADPAIKPVETSRRTALASPADPMDQRIPFSPSHERKGISATRVIAMVVILVLATGAGVYFGTNLLRQPVKQEPPAVAETAAAP